MQESVLLYLQNIGNPVLDFVFELVTMLEEKYVQFSTKGNIIKKVFRFIIGLTGALLFLSGFKLLFPSVDAFHFLRYALTGLWITLLFPFIGKRIGLFV